MQKKRTVLIGKAAGIEYTLIKTGDLVLRREEKIKEIEKAYTTFHEWMKHLRSKGYLRLIDPRYWIALLQEKEVNRIALSRYGTLTPEEDIQFIPVPHQ